MCDCSVCKKINESIKRKRKDKFERIKRRYEYEILKEQYYEDNEDEDTGVMFYSKIVL